jgi:transposase InsO family protein
MTYEHALHELGRKWLELPRGSKDGHVTSLASTYGKSKSSVYTELSTAGYLPKRKQRADAGKSICTPEQAQLVANLQYQGDRQNDKVMLPLCDALIIAKENGVVPKDLHISTVTRVMNQYGIHPKQLRRATPYRKQRSLHPNHVWVFDVSVCVLFYLKGQKSIKSLPEKEFYKNKPGNLEKIAKERVLRYLVVDHYSGAFFVKYYNVPGENWHSMFQFLTEAMQKRGNDPFYGIPKILYADKGSALSDVLRRFFEDKLKIRIIQHQAGNPRAKGTVETMHNWVERKWEGRFHGMDFSKLDHLNEETYKWTRAYNNDFVMRRIGKTRWELWQKIKPQHMVLAPPMNILQDSLDSKIYNRVVEGEGPSLVYETRRYYLDKIVKLGAPVRIGERIEFFFNPLEYPDIYVLTKSASAEKQAWQVKYEAPEQDEYGVDINSRATVIGEEPQAAPDTATDKARKAMNKTAYGVEKLSEVDAAKKNKAAKFPDINMMADVNKAVKSIPDYLPKRGELHEVKPNAVQRIALPFADALGLVVEQLGRNITAQERKQIKAAWPNGISRDDVAVIVKDLDGGTVRTHLRAVNG